MAWFLFIDESGQDHKESPYEVLAGVAIRDADLGAFIHELHEIEINHFGRRYSQGSAELKGKKILKRKVFQHANLNVRVNADEIKEFAKAALDDGSTAGIKQLKALAIAKINYMHAVLDLCERFHTRVFASVTELNAPGTGTSGLRKDYAYLFERFFYFLEDMQTRHQGIIVFDELDKSKSHILIDQADVYFRNTAIGKQRAAMIVPEPFFVSSDLTTGVQIADLIAYTISWAFRAGKINKPLRDELVPFAKKIRTLCYRTTRNRNGNPDFVIWSVAHISDLRTNTERLAEQAIDDG